MTGPDTPSIPADEAIAEASPTPADRADRPDLGRTPDAMVERLTGSDSGSDTRAGSLQGGAATGSDVDPDSDIINAALAAKGRASAAPQTPASVEPGAIKNTGVGPGEDDLAKTRDSDQADAATS